MNTHYHVVESFINTLIDAGVASFALSPGSRSTPLAVYAARQAQHERARVDILTDERSAGFFAVGMAKAQAKPAILICTSGTAAANYLPAVVEAHYAHTPLIVLTADRPPEARDMGAAQTIDQVGLFGPFVQWSADMPLPEDHPDIAHYFKAAALRAVAEAASSPTGPVHINFPFREPLIPPVVNPAGHASKGQATHPALAYGPPRRLTPDTNVLQSLARDLASLSLGVLVCGPQPSPELVTPAIRLAQTLGIPLLADPLSQLRYGPHDRSGVIDTYDLFLRDPSIQDRLSPDFIIRLGALPTSKPLNTFLKSKPVRHIVVDPNAWSDPLLCATDMVRADPVAFCESLTPALSRLIPLPPAPSKHWLARWQRLNQLTRHHRDNVVTALSGLFEGRVFAELTSSLPEESILFVGNSMPVRDLDAFGGSSDKSIRTMANRGANGIDGVLSTALGVAAATAKPLALVVGDLSMLHDLGGLAAARTCRSPVVIVVVNNDGGGIFSFLAQAREVDDFEHLFGTPHGVEFSHAAAMFGLPYAQPQDWQQFRDSVANALRHPGVSIIELTSQRTDNYAMHRDVERRVLEAVTCSFLPTE